MAATADSETLRQPLCISNFAVLLNKHSPNAPVLIERNIISAVD